MPYAIPLDRRECDHCINLAVDFPFPQTAGFPGTAEEILNAPMTSGSPFCPHCDRRAGHIIEEIGIDGYLETLYHSLQSGRPETCELCVHRSSHYVAETGMFSYLATVEAHLQGRSVLAPAGPSGPRNSSQ